MLNDDELNATLESLGLSRQNHRAVVLLPLIEVAWADGRIQRAERVRIVQIARRFGIDGRSPWLARWLDKRPSRKIFLAARTALLDLMARSDYGEPPIDSLDDLLDCCLWIAEAAGGLFGLAFTIERSERECIEQIAASLSLGPALPDGLVEQWEISRRRHFLAEAPTSMRRRGPRYGILDQTTAHLNLSQLPTAQIEQRQITSPTIDPAVPSRPTLEPVAPSTPPRAPVVDELRTTDRPARPLAASPTAGEAFGAPPPVPAHLAAVSRAPSDPREASGPKDRPSGPTERARPRVRAAEEDPTLPFFDDVNVGTYVDPPE